METEGWFEETRTRLPQGWHLEGQVLMVGGGMWGAFASCEGRFRRGLAGNAKDALGVLARDFDTLPEYADWQSGLRL